MTAPSQNGHGLLTDEHRHLIDEMEKDGSLTGSNKTEGNLYWNKPGSIEGVDNEVRQMEVNYWFEMNFFSV